MLAILELPDEAPEAPRLHSPHEGGSNSRSVPRGGPDDHAAEKLRWRAARLSLKWWDALLVFELHNAQRRHTMPAGGLSHLTMISSKGLNRMGVSTTSKTAVGTEHDVPDRGLEAEAAPAEQRGPLPFVLLCAMKGATPVSSNGTSIRTHVASEHDLPDRGLEAAAAPAKQGGPLPFVLLCGVPSPASSVQVASTLRTDVRTEHDTPDVDGMV